MNTLLVSYLRNVHLLSGNDWFSPHVFLQMSHSILGHTFKWMVHFENIFINSTKLTFMAHGWQRLSFLKLNLRHLFLSIDTDFIYLKAWVMETEKTHKEKRAFICWFTPKLATTARTRPGSPCRTRRWVARAQGHPLLFLLVYFQGTESEAQELELTSQSLSY